AQLPSPPDGVNGVPAEPPVPEIAHPLPARTAWVPPLDRPGHVVGELRPNPARHVDGPAEGPRGAPTPWGGERRRVGPLAGARVEDERLRESRDEIFGGGGEEGEVTGDGDGLQGVMAGYEGGVAEEEAERGSGEHAPEGGDWVEGLESEVSLGLGLGLGVGDGEKGVEGEERREGRGVDEAAPGTADGKEEVWVDEGKANLGYVVR
ncbi:hypothetical protein PanWU01x14_243180, partial [Parasponia andersonii]